MVKCFGGPLDGQEIPLVGKATVTLSNPSYKYDYLNLGGYNQDNEYRVIAVYAGIR